MLSSNQKSETLTKYVKVADEDDDRHFEEKDPITNKRLSYDFKDRIYLNPKFVLAQQKGIYGGWHPAISLSKKTNEEVHLPSVQTLEETKQTYGAIWCSFQPWEKLENGEWLYRISCWGGDDDMVAKSGMKKEKAIKIWNMINNHIPKRTLHRLGFAYD